MQYCWIFLLVSHCTIGQSAKEFSSAVDSLALESNHIYFDLNYLPYQRLRQQATNQYLEILVNHSAPSVRAYAFSILLERKSPKIESIFNQHLQDSALISNFNANDVIFYPSTIAEYMLGQIRSQQYPLTQMSYENYQKKLDTLHGNIIKVELPEIEVDPEELEEDSL